MVGLGEAHDGLLKEVCISHSLTYWRIPMFYSCFREISEKYTSSYAKEPFFQLWYQLIRKCIEDRKMGA